MTALSRVVGVHGATLLGLGSILGTGIFVSVGLAAGIAGAWVVVAVILAALVATFNALSSAQLAAAHPVSGGTYEYGHRYLNPTLGFSAGWMFLCAKSASAATAALGFGGYLLAALGVGGAGARVALAGAATVVLTGIVAGGMRRSNRTNAAIVSITVLALLAFVGFGIPQALHHGPEHLSELSAFGGGGSVRALLHATALMFVAYTGYGRIATLGEEVREPDRSIPRAIIVTLLVSATLYASVALVAVAASGAEDVAAATREEVAPLVVLARQFSPGPVAWLVTLGAVTAMLGVLLNLLLGLSRVLLAMSRRGDAPRRLSRVAERDGSPRWAVGATGALVLGLVLVGSVKLAWSFSAFTVLLYYAITNLAALRLGQEERRYPRWVAAAGLVSCLGLAFWVEPEIWGLGLGVLAFGLAARWMARHTLRRPGNH